MSNSPAFPYPYSYTPPSPAPPGLGLCFGVIGVILVMLAFKFFCKDIPTDNEPPGHHGGNDAAASATHQQRRSPRRLSDGEQSCTAPAWTTDRDSPARRLASRRRSRTTERCREKWRTPPARRRRRARCASAPSSSGRWCSCCPCAFTFTTPSASTHGCASTRRAQSAGPRPTPWR